MMKLKLKKIIEGLDNSFGQQFFENIVLNLASVIDTDYLFIASIDASKQTSNTIAMVAKGKIVDNIIYDLKDTPCENVSKNTSLCITHNVTKLYPKDKLLQDMDIEVYIGVPLCNSHGKLIGIMVALSQTEIENKELPSILFQVFSGRIVAEMEKEALELSNRKHIERYELAFLGSNDGLWDWNIEENSIYLSPRWKEMLGYSENEIEDSYETWHSRIHPDDLEQTMQDVQNYIDKKNPTYENYHRMQHKNGSWIWILSRGKANFDDNGKAIRFIGTYIDVTKEKTLEQELIELNNSLEEKVEQKVKELNKSKQYYEEMVENLSDWVWEVDENAVYTYCNQKVYDIIGYTPQEVVGKKPFDFMSEEEVSRVGKIFTDIASKKQIISNLENELIHKDGHKVMCDTNGIPLFDEDGNLLGYRGVDRDVTKEKKLKKEKEIQDKQMFHQSRLAQMGEMISMIAHQWRQPLGAIAVTTIDLKLQIELEKYNLEQKHDRKACQNYFKNSLDNIESLIQNLTTIIDDFRDFYKQNKLYALVDINETVKKALNILRGSLVEDNITLKEDYKSKKEILIIESEVMQVILNIMKNALDNFNIVMVPEATLWIKTIDTDDGISLSICDNGGGIPQEIVPKIFDPYFSTKEEKNGTGLGLYMSKIIIEEHHNGMLQISNQEDGVCFKLTL